MAPLTPEALAKSGTEHGEQVALMQWCALNRKHAPELDLLFAVPNGGERNIIVAGRLKAEGVKTGVPDLFLPVPKPTQFQVPTSVWYHGLFIEMKKPAARLKRAPAHVWDTGGVSDQQVGWLNTLTAQGYKCVVCYSWLEAANQIKLYLTGTGL